MMPTSLASVLLAFALTSELLADQDGVERRLTRTEPANTKVPDFPAHVDVLRVGDDADIGHYFGPFEPRCRLLVIETPGVLHTDGDDAVGCIDRHYHLCRLSLACDVRNLSLIAAYFLHLLAFEMAVRDTVYLSRVLFSITCGWRVVG
jgi:hypothetical protein